MTGLTAAYGGTPLCSIQYTRDTLGRISQKTETIGGSTNTYSYTYDGATRLTGVQKNGVVASTYTYDTNGNRTAGTYDGQDRLIQYGSTTYTYKASGELLSKTAGGQTTTYDYDELGNLLDVTMPGGTQITYLLDGRSRRIGKVVNGVLAKGFLYQDALRPAAELDGNGNVVARFIYATEENTPVYLIKGGSTYRVIKDYLGSPRLLVDVATGQVAQELDYDEFGNIIRDTSPGFQPFGFAGGIYDPDTTLVHFGARDYDPQAGRWTAKDPILFNGGQTNLYVYTGNDPVNFIDPWGLVDVGGLVCDGSGTDVAWIDPSFENTVLASCIYTHEHSHQGDIPGGACQGPDGPLPKGTPVGLPNSSLNESEYYAYQAELDCLNNLLQNKSLSALDKAYVNWDIDQCKGHMNYYLNRWVSDLKDQWFGGRNVGGFFH